ncbi:MAG: citryl-CoA lyase [Rhodospirillaceae bacterium]|jgi:citrate synthase|nr:citryl-CoA lyase [Rhodospirillaceae bacterium]
MPTRDMSDWQTSISQVISTDDDEDIIIRGHSLDDLIDDLSFAGMMFLMLQGTKPTPEQTRVLDALLIACMEHGIAPPSMISRCFASYGTNIQSAVAGGILAFGDKMGGLGEQLAKLMVENLADLADPSDEDLRARAAGVVADIKAQGGRMPGYGIPLHGADPRAPKVMNIAKQHGTHGRYGRFAEAIGDELTRARGGRPIPMNVDGVSAAVILDLGFPWQSTRMFLLTPRSVSMGAHYLEEQVQDTTWRHIPADGITYTGK